MHKLATFLIALAFGLGLAIIIGQRLSRDSLAIIVGVAAGVAASVPTSLLLMALLRRERMLMRPPQETPVSTVQTPNIVMLSAADILKQSGYQVTPMAGPPANLLLEGGARRLRVVGDDEDWG